jgi:hypothetical protein
MDGRGEGPDRGGELCGGCEHFRSGAAQWRCPRAADLKVVLAAQPVDFRKSVHTLSALVSEALRANPYCGDVFVFRSKRTDRVKLLAWGGSGMVLAAPAASFNPPNHICKETADQKPKSGKLEYCQKPNQRCSSGRCLFFTDD